MSIDSKMIHDFLTSSRNLGGGEKSTDTKIDVFRCISSAMIDFVYVFVYGKRSRGGCMDPASISLRSRPGD